MCKKIVSISKKSHNLVGGDFRQTCNKFHKLVSNLDDIICEKCHSFVIPHTTVASEMAKGKKNLARFSQTHINKNQRQLRDGLKIEQFLVNIPYIEDIARD